MATLQIDLKTATLRGSNVRHQRSVAASVCARHGNGENSTSTGCSSNRWRGSCHCPWSPINAPAGRAARAARRAWPGPCLRRRSATRPLARARCLHARGASTRSPDTRLAPRRLKKTRLPSHATRPVRSTLPRVPDALPHVDLLHLVAEELDKDRPREDETGTQRELGWVDHGAGDAAARGRGETETGRGGAAPWSKDEGPSLGKRVLGRKRTVVELARGWRRRQPQCTEERGVEEGGRRQQTAPNALLHLIYAEIGARSPPDWLVD
ncbi:hypothetical protein BRADI_4g29282v3 [Brachypodium distachyon]|uniref:Uncharacterized protein n=1 Tax=Brachypodium distachyon TaxID=15368 RepID=A0A0Q3PKZ3_BRADI|nr:hypothetical protein BRADI_4g29282v3 [Brachypodium distachyon]